VVRDAAPTRVRIGPPAGLHAGRGLLRERWAAVPSPAWVRWQRACLVQHLAEGSAPGQLRHDGRHRSVPADIMYWPRRSKSPARNALCGYDWRVQRDPIFSDPSGRRRRVLRRLGLTAAALLGACLAAILVSMAGGPQAPFTRWADPASTAVPADASHASQHHSRHTTVPSQRSGQVGAPGSTSRPPGTSAAPSASPSSSLPTPSASPTPTPGTDSSPAPTNPAGHTPPGKTRPKPSKTPTPHGP